MVGSAVLKTRVTAVAKGQFIVIQQARINGTVDLVTLAASQEGVGGEKIIVTDFIVAEQAEVPPAV